jgi:hypothetical protein
MGRRLSYFLTSLFSVLLSAYIFHWLEPTSDSFLMAVLCLGLVST